MTDQTELERVRAEMDAAYEAAREAVRAERKAARATRAAWEDE